MSRFLKAICPGAAAQGDPEQARNTPQGREFVRLQVPLKEFGGLFTVLQSCKTRKPCHISYRQYFWHSKRRTSLAIKYSYYVETFAHAKYRSIIRNIDIAHTHTIFSLCREETSSKSTVKTDPVEGPKCFAKNT